MKSLLVPVDFTEVARVAMEHAAKLAETIGADVVLLHVVSKASEVAEAKDKLAKEAKIISDASSVNVRLAVRIGNIFEDIAQTAAEESAELIIMGTHGAKGWQKLSGSYALKVITSSEVPFIVVQKKGIKDNGYDDIVVPMDLGLSSKQKLEQVADMARYFNSRVHIFADRVESHADKVKNNIIFAHKYLTERGIKPFYNRSIPTHCIEDTKERTWAQDLLSKSKVSVDDLTPVTIDGASIEYSDSVKYLGVTIVSDVGLCFSAVNELRTFYRASNSLLSVLNKPSEEVMMHLLFTNCVPVISYACNIKSFSAKEMRDLNTAINDSIRKIFSFNRWESVRALREGCGLRSIYDIFADAKKKLNDSLCSHSNSILRFLHLITL